MIERIGEKYMLYCDMCFKEAYAAPLKRAWFDTYAEAREYAIDNRWHKVSMDDDETWELCPHCSTMIYSLIENYNKYKDE